MYEDKDALALAPEAMTDEQLDEAIDFQLEFLKNVGARVTGSNPIFNLPPIELLKELDKLCALVHSDSQP